MSALRALLSLMWLVGALVSPMAATAHTLSMMTPSAPPCHMDMPGVDAKGPAHKPTPPIDSGLMPCCSQPVIVAVALVHIPLPRQIATIRLVPPPEQALIDRPRRIDPRPPKIA